MCNKVSDIYCDLFEPDSLSLSNRWFSRFLTGAYLELEAWNHVPWKFDNSGVTRSLNPSYNSLNSVSRFFSPQKWKIKPSFHLFSSFLSSRRKKWRVGEEDGALRGGKRAGKIFEEGEEAEERWPFSSIAINPLFSSMYCFSSLPFSLKSSLMFSEIWEE